MLSVHVRCFRRLVVVLAFGLATPLFSGCGGGGSGPQVNPTLTPVPTATTIPVARGRIAWMSDRDGTFHLYIMNGDGTGQVRLTQNSGLERSPVWSKDGTRLLFSYSADNTASNSEIYSIRSDATGLTRLTNNTIDDNFPAISSDSQYITWSQVASSTSSGIFVARSDGTGAVKVSLTGEVARTPTFDPQGRVVYSARANSKARYQIIRVNRDGSGRTIIAAQDSNLYSPAVSPDGQTLLYVDDKVDPDNKGGDFQLFVSPIATFTPQKLPFTKPGDADPRWTPDGRIVFSSIRDANPEIYVSNLDGSSLRRLTSNLTNDRLPVATGPLTQ